MSEKVNYYATGKRKNSIAKVRLVPGEGKIVVNKKDYKEYFNREALTTMIIEPLKLTNTDSAYDVVAQLLGGGITGQAGALRHGISKALLEINEDYRAILKREGFLTRDSRIKERKKYGLKKARKKPQFSKR
ncbi:MAG: 30S ribosomal protein S9 [Actinobacteria bacterium]|nr:30S ribosomal protein S9 [Actinomycetota bacterium]